MDAPHARLRGRAASVATASTDADEALREHLATEPASPELVFELEGPSTRRGRRRGSARDGMARGKMTIAASRRVRQGP
jgi:hypothetical protein